MNPHTKKLIAIACLSLADAAASAPVVRMSPAPGTLAFSSASYGVTEAAGSARIRVRRVGGADGEVVGKATCAET